MASIAERIGSHAGQLSAKSKFADLIFDSLTTAYSQMAAFVEQVEETRGDLQVEQVYAMKNYFQLCNNLNSDLDVYSADFPGISELVNEMDEQIDSMGVRFHTRRIEKFTAVSSAQAMELFSRSRSTIYRWIKNGKLNAEKQGNRWVIFI